MSWSDADEVARVRAQAAADARTRDAQKAQQAALSQVASLQTRITAGIPVTLARLKELGYPGLEYLPVQYADSAWHRWFGGNPPLRRGVWIIGTFTYEYGINGDTWENEGRMALVSDGTLALRTEEPVLFSWTDLSHGSWSGRHDATTRLDKTWDGALEKAIAFLTAFHRALG